MTVLGIRGINSCPCGEYDVFGWYGRSFGSDPTKSGMQVAAGIKTMCVNAPYLVARGSVAAGSMPPPNGNWEVGLLMLDPYPASPAAAKQMTDVIGARVIYDSDSRNYVVYHVGIRHQFDGESPALFAVTVVDLAATTPVGQSHPVPLECRLSGDSEYSRWSGSQTYGPWNFNGAGSQYDSRCLGFSRNSLVQVDNQRVADGLGSVSRFIFSTGKWAVGYAESAVTASGSFICLPAMMSQDGEPWVLAKEYNTLQMTTGIWTNELCYNQDNPPDPLVTVNPDLPAVLTPAEVVHVIPPYLPSVVTNWEHVAYTRCRGYDYILADFFDVDGPLGTRYWDGRRGVWSSASPSVRNIYAFANGDVALAGPRLVSYINANGSPRWSWIPPGESTIFGSGEAPTISGNEEWVQIKNMAIVLADFETNFPKMSADELPSANSAGLSDAAARRWVRKCFGNGESAVSLSRAIAFGDQPNCVVHRALEHATDGSWTLNPGDPAVPFAEGTAPYTVNLYADETTLRHYWGGATSMQDYHSLRLARGNGGQGFDCIPSCKCGVPISPLIPF